MNIYICRSGLFHILESNDIVTTNMLEKIIPFTTIASLCLLALVLNTTTPASAGPFGILAIFIFAYLAALGLMTHLLYWVSRIISHLMTTVAGRKSTRGMTFKKAYYYSTVLAASPIMLIGLQSVGSIGGYEFVLVLLFTVIGCVYITRRIT